MGGSIGGGRPTAGRRHGGSRRKADPGHATPLGAAPEDPHGEAKVVSPLGTGAANGARGGSRDGGGRGGAGRLGGRAGGPAGGADGPAGGVGGGRLEHASRLR